MKINALNSCIANVKPFQTKINTEVKQNDKLEHTDAVIVYKRAFSAGVKLDVGNFLCYVWGLDYLLCAQGL
jgi:pyruvate carboxylase